MVRVELAAAQTLDDPLGFLHAAPLPDALLQRGFQRLHVALGPLGIKVVRLAQVVNGLCAVGTAQGITRKITDVAHGPVDVLQTAVGVVGLTSLWIFL